MSGEGEYNLNIVTEEKVTESFLGMDQSVRGCQNEEHYDECTTRQYIEKMKEKCGCLPLSSALSDQVNFFTHQSTFPHTNLIQIQDNVCKTTNELQCSSIKSMSMDNATCLKYVIFI